MQTKYRINLTKERGVDKVDFENCKEICLLRYSSIKSDKNENSRKIIQEGVSLIYQKYTAIESVIIYLLITICAISIIIESHTITIISATVVLFIILKNATKYLKSEIE